MCLVDIQRVSQVKDLPTNAQFKKWVFAALSDEYKNYEVVIRIVDEPESAGFNDQYRQNQGPTNVLSFPFDAPEDLNLKLLGDLVVCAPVVIAEARLQDKVIDDHWAHIIVHGILHLQGYDHIDEADAQVMESQELKILKRFKINNPYCLEKN